MSNNHRKWLVEALKLVLVPEFEKRGFSIIPLSGELSKDRDYRFSYPFGRLRRMKEKGFELIGIKLSKKGSARFSLTIGTVPIEGNKLAFGKIVPPKDVWADDLETYYCLFRNKFLWSDFSIRQWPWKTIVKADYFKLAEEVAKLISEIDEVFATGKCGPHISRFDLTKHSENIIRIMEKVKREREWSNE